MSEPWTHLNLDQVAFEAGPDRLELLVFGPHHEGGGEPVDDDWVS